MWTWSCESRDKQTIRFFVQCGDRHLTLGHVLDLWRDSAAFRAAFTDVLAAAPFEAFRWETPAVATCDRDSPFEFVLVESPELLTVADPSPFARHFSRAGSAPVVAFRNLGGDAELVVPCPLAPGSAYAHLAAFVRTAPDLQRHALWRELSLSMERRLDEQPVWLNTAGGGVAWLHVRLDDTPKYYVHQPYRLYRRRAATDGTRT